MAETPQVVVFYWPGSPWASKVISYLQLRGIEYMECHQPITMPRPDLEALGVNYRRIPVVAIGRDVYCDTLLILDKLESMDLAAKKGKLGGKNAEKKALEKLLEKWTDLAVFPHAADCIPLDHPLVVDPKFIKDRSELWGDDWDQNARAKKRPDGLVNMRLMFDFLENVLLSDGREWALDTPEPSLADIHAAWIFDWMLSLEGSFPANLISKETHPKTIAWCDRYSKAVAAAKEAGPEPKVLEGDAAIKQVSASRFSEPDGPVEDVDPLGLKAGQKVTVSPTDTGFTAADTGTLDTLTSEQIAIRAQTKDGSEIKIHTPRWNFRVKAA